MEKKNRCILEVKQLQQRRDVTDSCSDTELMLSPAPSTPLTTHSVPSPDLMSPQAEQFDPERLKTIEALIEAVTMAELKSVMNSPEDLRKLEAIRQQYIVSNECLYNNID